jgi:hypothetical protein
MKFTTGLITVLVLGFLVLTGLVTIVVLTGHDAVLYVGTIGTLLTSLAGFVFILRGQKTTQDDVNTIKTNTNGTLSAAMQKIDETQAKLDRALALIPPQHADVVDQTLTKDAVAQVVAATPTPAPVEG